MRAVSGSLSCSSVRSGGPDGSSQHYYQAVTEDLPSEYWVRCPPLSELPLLLGIGRSRCIWVAQI